MTAGKNKNEKIGDEIKYVPSDILPFDDISIRTIFKYTIH